MAARSMAAQKVQQAGLAGSMADWSLLGLYHESAEARCRWLSVVTVAAAELAWALPSAAELAVRLLAGPLPSGEEAKEVVAYFLQGSSVFDAQPFAQTRAR